MQLHPNAKYFEDFNVGDKFETPSRTINQADIVAFAGLSGDYHPVHTSEEWAKNSMFGSRIAHGLLTLAISSGLVVSRLGILEGTAEAFLGLEQKFTAPVRPGDTIAVELEVLEKKETKNPGRGVVVFQVITKNQRGEVVGDAKWNQLLTRKG